MLVKEFGLSLISKKCLREQNVSGGGGGILCECMSVFTGIGAGCFTVETHMMCVCVCVCVGASQRLHVIMSTFYFYNTIAARYQLTPEDIPSWVCQTRGEDIRVSCAVQSPSVIYHSRLLP